MTRLAAFWPLAVLAACFSGVTFLLSSGQFTIDEFIYFAGADAFMRTGNFVVQNGGTDLTSPQLELLILVSGPNGLVPQYPPGMTVVGAPLLSWFGMHGLMLVNALASAVTLFVLYHMAERHFGGRQVAIMACALLLGGTFFLEYAFAIWPHGVSIMCVTIAMKLLFDSLEPDSTALLPALGIGAAVGVGLLFRTDTVLALPVIGLAVLLFAQRPILRLFLTGLGLAPFVVAASLTNLIKFGTLNPLSYGHAAGRGINFAHHLPLMGGLFIAAIAIVALILAARRIKNTHIILWAGAALLLLGALVLQSFTARYLHGFWGLVVDATALHDSRPGVIYLPDGTVSFWGLWKKALGQSMPWLGLLPAAAWSARKVDRRIKISILVLAAVWSLPFFPKDWHGGMGSNMRYFLPLVPLACALAAALMCEFCSKIERPIPYLAVGAMLGIAAFYFALRFTAFEIGHVNQVLPTWLFILVAALTLATATSLGQARYTGKLLLVSLGGALAISSMLAAFDFGWGQVKRNQSVALSKYYAGLPERSLAYVPARFTVGWSLRPDHYLASPGTLVAHPTDESPAFDFALINEALAKNFRVFVTPPYVTDGLRNHPGIRLVNTDIGPPKAGLLEVVRTSVDAAQPETVRRVGSTMDSQ